MAREDIEQIDIEAAAESPATRSMLVMFKALILQLMDLLDQLRVTLAAQEAENAELKKALFGPKSERKKTPAERTKPTVSQEEAKARQADGKKKRAANREARQELPAEDEAHPTPTTCPTCQSSGPFEALPPVVSYQTEVVQAHLRRIRHIQEKCVCGCGQILSGPAPVRVGDCSHYGPGLHADAVVSKCADAIPIHRLARRYGRAGFKIARSTLTDLFHRSAELLQPLHRRLLELVALATYVNADETPQPVMDSNHCRRGYIWTFIGGPIVAFVFSASRSGLTALRVLGDSDGVLQVDGYTGYNQVTTPSRRRRVGCIAHVRRYFYKAQDANQAEADHVLDLIRKLYRVEVDAAALGLLGTPAHRAIRRARSKPLMDDWKKWLDEQQPLHTPKGPLGKAIGYAINQWKHLQPFLEDPKIRLDNNISEGKLRIIALGRDNFRWVGHDVAGEHLAILQTLVSTCVACGINPHDYLADVLLRVATHPASALDDLLPMNWKPAD